MRIFKGQFSNLMSYYRHIRNEKREKNVIYRVDNCNPFSTFIVCLNNTVPESFERAGSLMRQLSSLSRELCMPKTF